MVRIEYAIRGESGILGGSVSHIIITSEDGEDYIDCVSELLKLNIEFLIVSKIPCK